MLGQAALFLFTVIIACGEDGEKRKPVADPDPPKKASPSDRKSGTADDTGDSTAGDEPSDNDAGDGSDDGGDGTTPDEGATAVTLTSSNGSDLLGLHQAGAAGVPLVVFLHGPGRNLHEWDALESDWANFPAGVLRVDLPHGATFSDHPNLTVTHVGKADPSLAGTDAALDTILAWAREMGYDEWILVASDTTAYSVLRHARKDAAALAVAVFSPKDRGTGAPIYNFAAEVKQPFYAAAPAAERLQAEIVLSAALGRNVTRQLDHAGESGGQLLATAAARQAFVQFLTKELAP